MEEKTWKLLAKLGSLGVLYYYFERLYEYIYFPIVQTGQGVLESLTNSWVWLLFLLITLIYAVPFLPLAHYGFRKEPQE